MQRGAPRCLERHPMNLLTENPYLIPSYRLKNSTNQQIRWLLTHMLNVSYDASAQLQSNLLVLFCLCRYLTADELTYYMGLPEHSFKSLHVQLNYLEKNGFLHKTALRKKDGFARCCYYLSREGYAVAASLFDEGIPSPFGRRGKESTVLHDYSLGLNALHLLLFRHPFSFIREHISGSGRAVSLRIDGVCIFKDRPERLFFEQDLGTEPTGTLIDKLTRYQSCGNMELPQTESIVFSFRKPYATCEPPAYPAYSAAFLKGLFTVLESKGHHSLKAFLKSREGMEFARSEGNIKMMDGIFSLIDVLGLRRMDGTWERDLSLNEIRGLATEIEELRCDHRVRDLNRQHYAFTSARFRALARILASRYRLSGGHPTPFIAAMLRGFCVWAVPTNLLVNFLPFICMELSGMHKSMEDALKKADPAAAFQSSLLAPRLVRENHAPSPLILRNIYTAGGRKKYCIEYISRDLGALLRAMRFREQYMDIDTGITLICLADSYEDALLFSSPDFIDCRGIPFTGTSRICFLLHKSLSDPSFFIFNSNGEKISFRLL